MCGIYYCVYQQSRSCQLPFCASPTFNVEIFHLLVIHMNTGEDMTKTLQHE